MSLPIFVCGILRAERFYLTWGYTDMGRVINGLAAIVQYNFKLDFFQITCLFSADVNIIV